MKVLIKYTLSFDMYQIKMMIKATIIRAIFQVDDNIPYLSVYLFKMKIYKRKFKIKKGNQSIINALKVVNTTNGRSTVSYGFNDPYTTGLMYGALSTLSNIEQIPDFLPQYEYIIVDGCTHVFLWSTIMNYLKYRRKIEV